MTNPPRVLILNGGSSSLKFALYEAGDPPRKVHGGAIERIGLPGTRLRAQASGDEAPYAVPVDAGDYRVAVNFLIDWLAKRETFAALDAVGHRLVHGLKHSEPERVTPALLEELRRIIPYDPAHLPLELELIEEIGRRFPGLPQVACFDTAFHRTLPRVARMLTLPRRYEAKGLERYGFHGLSYAYLLEELERLGEPAARKGRVLLAHLGNGASLCAVRDGKSVDTTMGFTPNSGFMMSTRSGDLDPGLMHYLMAEEGLSPARMQAMTNAESGLLGVSGTSSDIRDLLAAEASDSRAGEAVDLFCYQVKKALGAFAAVLGGVDALVFAGGIGENSPEVRERICAGLEFLGIRLDAGRNAENAPVVSGDGETATVRVVRTDEERMIAGACLEFLESLR